MVMSLLVDGDWAGLEDGEAEWRSFSAPANDWMCFSPRRVLATGIACIAATGSECRDNQSDDD